MDRNNQLEYLHIYDKALVLEYTKTVSAGNILQFKAYMIDDDGNLKSYDDCYELTRQEVRNINKKWLNDYLDYLD